MSESKQRFVEELLAADPPSPDARRRYEEEVRAMLEKTLTPPEKRPYLVGAAIFALLAVPWALMAVGLVGPPHPPFDPDLGKFVAAILGVTALALFGVAGIFFRVYRRGALGPRTTRGWAAGVGVGYVGMLWWLMLLTAQYVPERLQNDVRVLGLVLLVYAAVAWVRHRVARAELATAEKLLEIELRLAEIGEKIAARPEAPAG